jgi:hypothetical protein
MLRSLLICAVISASAIACSATQPRPDSRAAAATTLRPCSLETGSRIPPRPDESAASAGRCYSEDEVRGTGQTNVADALRILDPSVTVHH